MSEYQVWILTRYGLPLGAAVGMLFGRWGRVNVVFCITVPFLFLPLRMFVSSGGRPECPDLEGYRPFHRAVHLWHALDAIALFMLMLFEAITPAIAEMRALIAIPVVFGVLFLPYAWLTYKARAYLTRARGMIATAEAWTRLSSGTEHD